MTTTTDAPQHHRAIRAEKSVPVLQAPEFLIGFLGIRTRVEFEIGMMPGYQPPSEPRMVTPGRPGFNEEYFEWIDVLESVAEAGEDFVMVELGAGYGRWLVRAAAAARRRGGCRFYGVGVEAEPLHFRWMRQHFKDNDVDSRDLELIWAAVGASPGFVPFWVGDANAWYGQAVADKAPVPLPDIRTRRVLKARSALGRPPSLSQSGQTVVWVPSVALDDILAPYSRIDLMDLDLQGVELDVIASVIDVIDVKVRRVHIGTHSAAIEAGLRALFQQYGWENTHDYACQTRAATPYGEIEFGDGVQTWLNPKLAPDAVTAPAAAKQSLRKVVRPSAPPSPPPVDAPQGAATESARIEGASRHDASTTGAMSRESEADLYARIEELERRNRGLREKNDLLRAKLKTAREKRRQ